MKLGRNEKWYHPYSIVVNGKNYYVNQILFYKDNSILCSTRNGWLEKNEYTDIEEVDLPTEEIKLKRKENFDGTIFAMTYKDIYDKETKVNLYIPAEVFDVHFVENHLEKYEVYAIYKGSNEIYIRKHIKSIDGKLYEIRSEYEEVHKKTNYTDLVYVNSNKIMENLDRLKELAMQYYEEKDRLDNLTIEDIDIE